MTGRRPSADSVTLTYVEDGKLKTVAAGHVVLACWHRVIPYITDELAEAQVEALNDQVKVPLIYTNVLIRNWEAFDKLKIAGFSAPKGFWNGAEIDFPVSTRQLQIRRQAVRSRAPASIEDAAPRRPAVGARPGDGRTLLWSTSLSRTWSARSATCSAAR